jgi:transposase InsO family protein
MAAENPTWGAPRIHGELLKLGFHLSEPTVSRWLRRMPRNPDPAKRWLAFLRNHREAIAAMDFFTVQTLTFGVLYCFFVSGHDRRKILRFNVTRNPNAFWIVQQMREAWPYAPAHRFLVFDHDTKFGNDVISSAKDMGSQPVRTAFRSPWQNGVAERWVGSCRRDLLDHVIVLNERHLKRLMTEYVHHAAPLLDSQSSPVFLARASSAFRLDLFVTRASIRSAGIGSRDEADFARSRCKVLTMPSARMRDRKVPAANGSTTD